MFFFTIVEKIDNNISIILLVFFYNLTLNAGQHRTSCVFRYFVLNNWHHFQCLL